MTSKIEQHSSPISDKKKRKLLFELERKERRFSRVEQPETSVQSEQAEPEQCK